jgi:uncharacterized protein (DUF169 family)
MKSLDVLHEYAESLENLLRLRSFPIAVRLLEKGAHIPEGAKRPRKDYGYRFMTCQGLMQSRRAGVTIAQTKDDMWCFEAALGYGFIEPNEYFLQGNTRFPEGIISTREGAELWAREFPRLEYGKYHAIVSAPLAAVSFEPDLVIIYADSAQITQLLIAGIWIDGHDITSRLSGMGGCVMSVVPVLQTGGCQVSFPCPGDRNVAFAQDDEVIFSAPIVKLEGLIAGLKQLKQTGFGLPAVPLTACQPKLLPSYMEMARMYAMLE